MNFSSTPFFNLRYVLIPEGNRANVIEELWNGNENGAKNKKNVDGGAENQNEEDNLKLKVQIVFVRHVKDGLVHHFGRENPISKELGRLENTNSSRL